MQINIPFRFECSHDREQGTRIGTNGATNGINVGRRGTKTGIRTGNSGNRTGTKFVITGKRKGSNIGSNGVIIIIKIPVVDNNNLVSGSLNGPTTFVRIEASKAIMPEPSLLLP